MEQANPAADLTHSEAQLSAWMLALAVVGTVGSLLSAHMRFGAGFAVGSGLGILNYRWLRQAVEALMSSGQGRPPAALFSKLILRYPLALAFVYFFFKTGWLPIQAILAGLFVPFGAVLIESVALVHQSWKTHA